MIRGRMPIDPQARFGRGGEDPGIPPFTADHTPDPGSTTSITGELFIYKVSQLMGHQSQISRQYYEALTT